MLSQKERKIIEELFLLRDFIKYIAPEERVEKRDNKVVEASRLEEELIRRALGLGSAKSDSNEILLNKKKNIDSLDNILLEIDALIPAKSNFEDKDDKLPDMRIDYQETEREERMQVEVEDDDQTYSFEVVREKKKEEVGAVPYQLEIHYESTSKGQRINAKYKLRDYPSEREEILQDFSRNAEKKLSIMPKFYMGGVLGFTYLGEDFMARRDDLVGDRALMVDIHEAIHTPDEYETRVLTDWIMSREKPKYRR